MASLNKESSNSIAKSNHAFTYSLKTSGTIRLDRAAGEGRQGVANTRKNFDDALQKRSHAKEKKKQHNVKRLMQQEKNTLLQ